MQCKLMKFSAVNQGSKNAHRRTEAGLKIAYF
jgi:hypothetical protein